ncbi:MAG: hypothetical protein HY689_06950 [Chloroflexi bacterium]|nr:hypothetical protein [Chloroflexota bacterium]
MLNAQRPAIGFDLDGVICRPPFGINFAIRRGLRGRPLPTAFSWKGGAPPRGRFLRMGLEVLRFAGRRPMPDAAAGLRAVVELRRPLLVTGRSVLGQALLERWLERHDLRQYFAEVLPNPTALTGPQYKLWTARTRGLREHVDDDGATVYYLALHGVHRVYLRDWPRNRGLPYPPSVQVIRSLEELAEHLACCDQEVSTAGGNPPVAGDDVDPVP